MIQVGKDYKNASSPYFGQYARAYTAFFPGTVYDNIVLHGAPSEDEFAAMLDRDAGSFRLGPADMTVPSDRRYLPGTMVLETTWGLPTGWAVVRDALLVGPWANEAARSAIHRRVPSDHSSEAILLRTVRCVNGSVDMACTAYQVLPMLVQGGLIAKDGDLWHTVVEKAVIGSSELSGAFGFDAGRRIPLLSGRLDGPREIHCWRSRTSLGGKARSNDA